MVTDFRQHTSAPEDEVEPANNKKEGVGMGNEKNSTESTVHNTNSYLQNLVLTNPLQEPYHALRNPGAQSPAGKLRSRKNQMMHNA